MIKTIATTAALLGSLVVCTAVSSAQTSPDGGQRYQPKVSMQQARDRALHAVPGSIRHEELEFEGGRWIYSFEIKPDGERRPIVKEVNIDADTGVQIGPTQTEKE